MFKVNTVEEKYADGMNGTFISRARYIDPYTREELKMQTNVAYNEVMIQSAVHGKDYRECLRDRCIEMLKRTLSEKYFTAYYEYAEKHNHITKTSLDIYDEREYIKWTISSTIYDIMKSLKFVECKMYVSMPMFHFLHLYPIFNYTDAEDYNNEYSGYMIVPYEDKYSRETKETIIKIVPSRYWHKKTEEEIFECVLIPEFDVENVQIIQFEITSEKHII